MFIISLQKLPTFWDIQISECENLQFHDVTKCLIINKKYILLNNFWSKHSLVMKFGQFLHEKFLSKNYIKTRPGSKFHAYLCQL